MDLQTVITIGGVFGSIGSIIACIKTINSISNDGINKKINKVVSPMLKDIKGSVDNINIQILDSKKESDKREMQRLRYECLCFASDLRKGIAKTRQEYEEAVRHREALERRQEYEEVFRMEDSYYTLINLYKIPNGYMHEEMAYVHKQYQSLLNI